MKNNINCFDCRFRYKSLRPDSYGGYPWKCSKKGGYRLTNMKQGCGEGERKPKKLEVSQ